MALEANEASINREEFCYRRRLRDGQSGTFRMRRYAPVHRDGNSDALYIRRFRNDLRVEGRRFRSLLLESALFLLTYNIDWNFLLPRTPEDRALTSRRLSAIDAAFVAILTNRAFDGMVGGCAYSRIPFLRRVARKASIRVTAPYASSHPNEWRITPPDRSFLPRRESIHSFKIGASAFGAFLRIAEVAICTRLH